MADKVYNVITDGKAELGDGSSRASAPIKLPMPPFCRAAGRHRAESSVTLRDPRVACLLGSIFTRVSFRSSLIKVPLADAGVGSS